MAHSPSSQMDNSPVELVASGFVTLSDATATAAYLDTLVTAMKVSPHWEMRWMEQPGGREKEDEDWKHDYVPLSPTK